MKISNKDVTTLQNAVQDGWITSLALIYGFAKKYTQEQLVAAVNDRSGLKVTKKANEYTAAAKLAFAELDQDTGQHVVCDVQVSRYSAACDELAKANVDPDKVKDYIKDNGLTFTKLFQTRYNGSQPDDLDDELYFAGVEQMQLEARKIKIDGTQINLAAFSVEEGETLFVISTDHDGNVTGIKPAKSDYAKIVAKIVTSDIEAA